MKKTPFLRYFAQFKGLDAPTFIDRVKRAAIPLGFDLQDLERLARAAVTWEIRIGVTDPDTVPTSSDAGGHRELVTTSSSP